MMEINNRSKDRKAPACHRDFLTGNLSARSNMFPLCCFISFRFQTAGHATSATRQHPKVARSTRAPASSSCNWTIAPPRQHKCWTRQPARRRMPGLRLRCAAADDRWLCQVVPKNPKDHLDHPNRQSGESVENSAMMLCSRLVAMSHRLRIDAFDQVKEDCEYKTAAHDLECQN